MDTEERGEKPELQEDRATRPEPQEARTTPPEQPAKRGNAEAGIALGILSLVLVVFAWSLGFPQNTWGGDVFWVVTLVGVLSMLAAVCLGLVSFHHGFRVRKEERNRKTASAFVLGFVSLIIAGAMLFVYLLFLVLSAI